MKRLFEPVIGFVLGMASWEAWREILISIIVAFIGGAAAYLGKWACAKCVQFFSKRKNVYTSPTREAINEHKTEKNG